MSTEFDRLFQQMQGTEQALSSPGTPDPFGQAGAPTPVPQQQQDPSLLDRFQESAGNRASSIVDTIFDVTGKSAEEVAMLGLPPDPTNNLDTGQAAIQMVGDTLGFVWDMGGDTLVEAATEGFQMLPQATQDATMAELRGLMASDVGQAGIAALNAGLDAWAGFSDKYPQEAKTIEAAFNIIPMSGTTKVLKKFPTEMTPMRVKDVGGRKILQAPTGRDKDMWNLAAPERTKTQRIEQVRAGNRTDPQGINRKHSTVLSDKEWNMVDELKTTGVSPAKTMQSNANIVQRKIDDLNQQVLNKTAKAKGGVEKDVLLRDIQTELDIKRTQNPAIFGADGKKAQKTLTDLYAQLDFFLDKHGTDWHGILRARQDFDNYLLENIKAGTFGNGRKATAATEVHRGVRDVLNGYVKDNVEGTGELLGRQHNLFNALDGIAPKAADEAGGAIGRLLQLFQIHMPSTPYAILTTATSPLFWAGALGATAASPFVLGWRGLAKPIAYSAPVRQTVGYTQQALRDTFKEAKKLGKYITDPEVMKAYRADLKVLASMIHTYNGEALEGKDAEE